LKPSSDGRGRWQGSLDGGSEKHQPDDGKRYSPRLNAIQASFSGRWKRPARVLVLTRRSAAANELPATDTQISVGFFEQACTAAHGNDGNFGTWLPRRTCLNAMRL
jgi:hypothetical protein